jgi:hypothetical protein
MFKQCVSLTTDTGKTNRRKRGFPFGSNFDVVTDTLLVFPKSKDTAAKWLYETTFVT